MVEEKDDHAGRIFVEVFASATCVNVKELG
jgi:hypothetical protein